MKHLSEQEQRVMTGELENCLQMLRKMSCYEKMLALIDLENGTRKTEYFRTITLKLVLMNIEGSSASLMAEKILDQVSQILEYEKYKFLN